VPPRLKMSDETRELIKKMNSYEWGRNKFEDQVIRFNPYSQEDHHAFAIDHQAMTTFQACCQECGGLERVRCRWVDRSPHWVCPCERVHAWNIVEMGEDD
jgi:hypothetical protein